MTPSEQRTFEFIRDYIAEHGWAPSYREVASNCGIGSIATVHARLKSLVALGVIRHDPRKPRAIQVLVAL